MTYAAFSANGPRIALASSKDLLHWERLVSQLSLRMTASISSMWITRMPASSRWPFPITVERCRWPCFIAPFSWHTTGGDCLPVRVAAGGSRSRKHLISYCQWDWKARTVSCSLFNSHYRLATPVESWRGSRSAAALRHSKSAWLVDHLPRRQRNRGPSNEAHPLCYSAGRWCSRRSTRK